MGSARVPAFMQEEFAIKPFSFLIDCWARLNWMRTSKPYLSGIVTALSLPYLIISTLLIWLALVFAKSIGYQPHAKFREAELIRALLQSDIVLFSGGGYLTDQGKKEAYALMLMGLMAASIGKPVYMTGQGIGPFNSRWSLFLLKLLGQKCKLIGLRDPDEGKKILLNLGVAPSKIHAIADDALTLPARNCPPQTTKTLAVHWRVSPHQNETDRVQAVLESALDVLAQSGWHLRLFVLHENVLFERAVYDAWLARYHWANATIIQSEDPRETLSAMSSCSAAIGMAYHFSVFAHGLSVPAVGLWHNEYYRIKLQGLFKLAQCPQLAIDDRHISTESLVALLTSEAFLKTKIDLGPLKHEHDAWWSLLSNDLIHHAHATH